MVAEVTQIAADSVPPLVSKGALTISNVTWRDLDISFQKATDETSLQGDLIYKLYRSTSDVLNTNAATVEGNGTLISTATDVNSFVDNTVSPETTYYYNIVVVDQANNKSIYASASTTTQAVPADTTPPTVGTPGLSADLVSGSSFRVNFTKATDDISLPENLIYRLYTSTSDNLNADPATVEANGTLQTNGTDVSSLSAFGLSISTTYYYNIVVEDEQGNKAIYTSNSQLTTNQADPAIDTAHPMAAGLQIYLDFFEAFGVTIADITGNGHDMTMSGGTWEVNGGETVYRLNGGSGGEIGQTAPAQLITADSDATYMIRFAHTGLSNDNNGILYHGDAFNGFMLHQQDWSDNFRLYAKGEPNLFLGSVLNNGSINTLFMVYNHATTEFLVYINGSLSATIANGGAGSLSVNDVVQVSGDTLGEYILDVSTVGIWDRALTAQEVTDYTNNPDIMLQ